MGRGRYNNSNNSSSKKKKTKCKKNQEAKSSWNFLPEAGPGCHIARRDEGSKNSSSWILEWEDVNASDFQKDEVCDLAIDPDHHTLTLCNIDNCYKVAYITVYNVQLKGRNGKVLASGVTTDSQNKTMSCTTLIVLCPPTTFAHLCILPETVSLSNLQLESDVQEWRRHPHPADTHAVTIGFPLLQQSDDDKQQGKFLCTQGVGGYLTHFFAGNLHAVDFRCDVGTPLLAVGNGTVVTVKTNGGPVTGIAVTNLFQWNSILLQLDNDEETSNPHPLLTAVASITEDDDDDDDYDIVGGPLYVEYVHIATATVQPGDRVVAGQVIGTAGSVGFSPEPHLHLACYRTADNDADTCRVFFRSASAENRHCFLPQAGKYYNANGPVVK